MTLLLPINQLETFPDVIIAKLYSSGEWSAEAASAAAHAFIPR
jgi:hypothetical protein